MQNSFEWQNWMIVNLLMGTVQIYLYFKMLTICKASVVVLGLGWFVSSELCSVVGMLSGT